MPCAGSTRPYPTKTIGAWTSAEGESSTGRKSDPLRRERRCCRTVSSHRGSSVIVRRGTGAVCLHSRCGNGFVRFSGGDAAERWSRSSLNRLATNEAEASSCALPVCRPRYAGPLSVVISASIRSAEICSSAASSELLVEMEESSGEPANMEDAKQVKQKQDKQARTSFIRFRGIPVR
jgi:hypothetical protein